MSFLLFFTISLSFTASCISSKTLYLFVFTLRLIIFFFITVLQKILSLSIHLWLSRGSYCVAFFLSGLVCYWMITLLLYLHLNFLCLISYSFFFVYFDYFYGCSNFVVGIGAALSPLLQVGRPKIVCRFQPFLFIS